MRIVVDSRERQSDVPRLLAQSDLTVEFRRLAAGDYAVGGGAVVERKTVRGLHLDLVAGRLWRQLGVLRRRARLPYLLVEGADLDDGPIGDASVRGGLLAAMDLGVPVICSKSAEESAMWLRLQARRRQTRAPSSRPAFAHRPKTDAGAHAAEAALASVPSISVVTAQALLDHFGSLAAVAAADPREWRQAPGVGLKRSNALLTTLRAPATTSRSRQRRERRGPST